MIYEQEYEFLGFCHELVERGISEKHGTDGEKPFKGLSRGGQKYFAELVSRKSLQFLLEKGGFVPGLLLKGGVRLEGYTFFSGDLNLKFSNDLTRVFLMMFNSSQKIEKPFSFSAGDTVMLLSMAEDYYANRRFMRVKNDYLMNGFINSNYLLGLCYLSNIIEILPAMREDTGRFFKDPVSWEILFLLRFYIRDRIISEFNAVMSEGSYQDLLQLGRTFDTIVMPLLPAESRSEALQPILQAIDVIFRDNDIRPLMDAKIERDLKPAYESDRVNARRDLLPLLRWVRTIFRIHERSLDARPWDDNYEYYGIFKRFYGGIGETSANNARAAADYLENTI